MESHATESPFTPVSGERPVAHQPDLLVVRFGEIFLKGDNRHQFVQCLEQNLRRALKRERHVAVETHHARAVVRATGPEADLERVLAKVLRVFGVTSASLAVSVPRRVPEMAEAGARLMVEAARQGARSFKVKARRSDKRFPTRSPEVNDIVGRAAREASGLKVDVHDPEVTLTVEIGPKLAFVATHVARGPGGLPVGVSGKVTLLLSGGIDSPVAGYLAQKRGSRLNAIYFHSFPYTGEGAKQKVVDLARELGQAQGGIRLSVIPFTALQEAFREHANPRLLVLLYRRAMMRIACKVAEMEGALALATGENLGQVASQTLENLGTIEDVADRPVLRPVISFDKAEIVSLAKRIGTYDISVQPFDDCCSLFVPRHPVTKGRIVDMVNAEAHVPGWQNMVERAVLEREILDLED
jgi:thiamine biosynthesis protein ThiI